jgi:hypothetical protein
LEIWCSKGTSVQEKTKLSSLWQGPYIVVEIAQLGAYRLAEIDGKVLPNMWNTDQLRCFYV